MFRNVAGYNAKSYGCVGGDRIDGLCSITFYSPTNTFPTRTSVYSTFMEQIKCTRSVGCNGSYISNLMCLYEEKRNTSGFIHKIASQATNGSFHRTLRTFTPCLGGMLVLELESNNKFSNNYVSSYNICLSLVNKLISYISCSAIPSIQMETEQGEIGQSSQHVSNTIITRDNDVEVTEEKGVSIPTLRQICSTEPEYTFDSVVNRWMALDIINFSINDSFNTTLKIYNLPKFLYGESFAPNLMPFQNFMYGNYNIEFKFVVNANKFHVGKIVCAVKYDSYQIDGIRNDCVSLLSRPHILLDMSASNEAMLSIPFKYHRTYVRNASSSSSNYGIKDAQYATVNVAVLSPLRIGPEAPTSVGIRPFYRIKEASFTGMSYAVPVVQMESILGAMLLERGLKFAGKIFNKDKPVDLERQSQYIPKPRMNFSTGKGASDAVPIKLDPATMTTFLDDHMYPEDPVTTLDIARIWGFSGKFTWSINQGEGTLLYSQPIDPTWRVASSFDTVPTPLEYISSMYQFWSGPLEIRLDFVSNAFHTGSIMMSAEYGRRGTNLVTASSTYTKVFDLRDQRSVTFIVPYIFDTVWRRTQCVPFCPIATGLQGGNYGLNALLRTMSSLFAIRVVNPLVPITSVTSTIDVLVFIRAGEEFTLHSPIMANLLNNEATFPMDSFPGTYPTVIPANSLIQFSPLMLEGKTGKDIRKYWANNIAPKLRENPLPAVLEVPVVIKEAEPIDPYIRESQRINEKKERILTNSPNSPLADLVKFQKRYEHYETSYSAEGYKFIRINKYGVTVEIHKDNIIVVDLASESIQNGGSWLKFGDYERANKYFHQQKLIQLIRGLNILEIPDVQMDNGNSANKDETDVFNQGVVRKFVQTVEQHINIKDLLRRPVMIIRNQSVNAFTGVNYYYIPCMPPSHMMALLTSNTPNNIYTANLSRSYHVHLNDMFRFWRGSQRWTFVVHNASDIVYITYIPHSGARVIGELEYGNVVGGNCPLGAFGLGTEILVPSINPTLVVETPFDMEDNWALMLEEQANRNYTWRDKGDTNCGHLMLWSNTAFTYDCWWAAGDDFCVSNFIGIPPCKNGMSQYYNTDNYPQVQMDSLTSTVTGALGSLFSNSTPLGIATSIPLIAGGAMLGSTCYKANNTLGKLETLSDEMTTQINDLVHSLAEKFSWQKNMVVWMTDTIFDLILCFTNWNITTLAITILRMLGHIFSLSMSCLLQYTETLISIFSTKGAATQADLPVELISGPYWTESKCGKLIGVVIGIIGLATGMQYRMPDASFIAKVVNVFTDFKSFAYLNNVLRFVTSIFDLVFDCLKWCCSQTNIEVAAIEKLKGRDDMLSQFVQETHVLLDESNANMFGNPHFKLRFWCNTIRARQIQKEIVKLPSNQVSAVLSKLCNDMIKKSNEKMCDLRSSPIKYEPLVICITGPSNIGKSAMVRYLVPKLLKAMGIHNYPSDAIYVRMQSSRFWNGYVDQPIVLVDDWMNIGSTELITAALNELYMLKSPATYIPEQAALEDKKARASPKIVILLCNNAFPIQLLQPHAPHMQAVLRRRDIVVNLERVAEYKNTDLHSMNTTEMRTCPHLSATFFANPLDQQSEIIDVKYNFEAFGDELARRAAIYDKFELQKVSIMFDLFKEQCGMNFGDIDDDPFSIFYNHVHTSHHEVNPNILPSENLNVYLECLLQKLKQPGVTIEGAIDSTESVPSTQGFVSNIVKDATYCARWLRNKFNAIMGRPGGVGKCAACKTITKGYAVCSGTKVNDVRTHQHWLCEPCYKWHSGATLMGAVCGSNPATGRCPLCGRSTHRVIDKQGSLLIASLWEFRHLKDPISVITSVWNDIDKVDPWNRTILTTIVLSLLGIVTSFVCLSLEAEIGKTFTINLNGAKVQMDDESVVCAKDEDITSQEVEPNNQMNDKSVVGAKDEDIPSQEVESNNPPHIEVNTVVAEPVFGDPDFVFKFPELTPEQLQERENARLEKERKYAEYQHERERQRQAREKKKLEDIVFNRVDPYDDPYAIDAQPKVVLKPQLRNKIENGVLATHNLYGFNTIGYVAMKATLYPNNAKWKESDQPLISPIECIHTEILNDMICVRYENKKFVTVIAGVYAPVPLDPCNDQCPWRSNQFRLQFCEKYFDAHIESMRPLISQLLSQPSTAPVAMEQYPLFMLPKWAQVTPLVNIDDKWYERISIHPTLKKAFKWVGALLVAFGFMKGMNWLYTRFIGSSSITQAPIASGDSVIRHFKPKIQKVGRSNVRTEGMNVEESVTQKVVKNYITLYVYINGKLSRSLNGVGIKQRIALIPRHYFNWIKDNMYQINSITIGRTHEPKNAIPYKFVEQDFLVSETSDIAVFYMPASTNMFPDITKYMFTDDDYKKKYASSGCLIRPPRKDTDLFLKLEIEIKKCIPECSITEDGKLQTFRHLLQYGYSEPGACGSLVLVNNHQRPIMSMHVAGTGESFSGTGYGVLLSQEMLAEIPIDPVSVQACDIEEASFLGDIEEVKIFLPEDSNIQVLGSLPPNLTPFTPYVSKIRRSLISNKLPWESTKEPAILSKKDKRYQHALSPLIAGCAKHGYLTYDFKSSQLREVRDVRSSKLSSMKPLISEASKLSCNEAVAGFDFQLYYETIKLDTSAGWPWCCSGNTLKKSYCRVDKTEEGITTRVVIDQTIINEIERKNALRKKGIVPVTIFVDTLKDEKKNKEKLLKLGGTRVFCASPFDYTISMRQNFLHFVATYMQHRHILNHSVGININGTEITQLVRALLAKGTNIVTIDYSNFGPGFNAGVAANVKHNMIEWTMANVSGCDEVELTCLLEEGINSVHAMNNFVYKQRGGSPSGSPITVVINSEVNIQYIYLAWLNLSQLTEGIWSQFEDNVALFVYGDDLIMSVSDKYINKFNGITIQKFFQAYNIVSTDASKSLKVKEYESIKEATFLKKKFDNHPIHRLEWIAKSDIDSIRDCPHWIQESILLKEATQVNAEACLREAYGHGREFFDDIRIKINKALSEARIGPILLTWDELDRQHYPHYYKDV